MLIRRMFCNPVISKRLVVVFLGVVFFEACVPIDKVVYMQSAIEKKMFNDTTLTKGVLPKVYQLQPGDILSIEISSLTPSKYNVFSRNEEKQSLDGLLSGYLVNETGKINIPYLGKITVAGLTLDEATQIIQDKANAVLANPTVVIKMMNYSYTILGEVNKPGNYTSYNTEVTLFEALAQAGDLTDFADRKNIKLVREVKDSLIVKHLNLLEEQLVSSETYYLSPGDFVYVAPLKVKNFRQFELPTIAVVLSALTVLSLILFRLN